MLWQKSVRNIAWPAESSAKLDIVRHLVERHQNDQVLVIGQYIDQLKELSEELHAPLLTGRTSNSQRAKLYEQFRRARSNAWSLARSQTLPSICPMQMSLSRSRVPSAHAKEKPNASVASYAQKRRRYGLLLQPLSHAIHATGVFRQSPIVPYRTGISLPDEDAEHCS